MSRAIQLARKGLYTCMPNPRVGCVLDKAGQVVGEGWHHKAGKGHAEVNGLREAGDKALGATAYVTLEPCSHYGRTPPCAQALIDAGVKRVVIGMIDPNPQVAGEGVAMLKEAGLIVETDLMSQEAHALNPGFIKRMETGRPFVRCKMAMSLDGRTAMASGESKWITGPDARADVQRLRGQSCAIITGIGSVLKDNPSMTFRHEESGLHEDTVIAARKPLRVVVDTKLRIPKEARLFSCDGPVLVVCGAVGERAVSTFLEGVNTFRFRNNTDSENVTEVLELPGTGGGVDLSALLQELGRRECNEVLLETGATLAGAAIDAALVDELWVYMAPVLMGSDAKHLFDLPLVRMSEKVRLQMKSMRAIGQDWRLVATFDGK